MSTSNYRKNEVAVLKWKCHRVVDVTGDRSKDQCGKEKYCIGPKNVMPMNQGKLEMAKQDLCRCFRNQQIKMDWNG